MQQPKTETKRSSQRLIILIAAVVGIVIIVLIILFYLLQPKPSVSAYCQVYKEEKARLAKLPGDTYASAVFNDEISDAGEFANSFSRLESVAPSDIRPDITTLRGIYKKIHDDPSQAISAGLSGLGTEKSVKGWTADQCK